QQLKEAKEHRERNKTQNFLTSEHNNPYIKNILQNKEQAEDSIDTKSITSECISDNEEMALEDEVTKPTINKESVTIVNITDIKGTDSMKTKVAELMITSNKIDNNLEETSFTTTFVAAKFSSILVEVQQ
ncbi:13299_t:CDS:2, partial [Cetraspora pellucida]